MGAPGAVAGQLDEIEHLVHPSVDLRLGEARLAHAVGNVPVDVEMRKDGVVLEHHVDRTMVWRHPGLRLAVDEDVAQGGLLETRQHPQQRRLAASGSTKKGKELSLANVEGYIVDSLDAAEVLRRVVIEM